LRGTPLKAVPGKGTRPTTDKVKEALFSIIGPYFDGGIALDLFAGTGGLGIEALSRGMDRAIFVDLEPSSIEVVRDNIRTCRLQEQTEVYRNDAARALKALGKRGIRPDIIFMDPPYRLDIVGNLSQLMCELSLPAPNAILVAEQPVSRELPDRLGGFQCRKRAEYGDTAIHIYDFLEMMNYDQRKGEAM
jgi:16S rRNA (guanine(966)-N(2))-methyltransferase RsmD